MSNGKEAEATPNQKVVTFAQGRLGHPVGTGDCFDLADQALRSAGAKSADAYGKITGTADYVWGDKIELTAARAGDVLQFRNHKITIKIVTKTKSTSPGGSTDEQEKWEEQSYQRAHHTAIVAGNRGGTVLEIYEQNVKPAGKRVQRHTIDLVAGKKEERSTRSDKGKRVEIVKTTIIKIDGQVSAYRPKLQ